MNIQGVLEFLQDYDQFLNQKQLLAKRTFGTKWLSARNKNITKSVTRDSIYKNDESIIIPPYGQIKRHFFVSRHDFKPNFTITLLSGKDNKPVRFGVSLAQKKVI